LHRKKNLSAQFRSVPVCVHGYLTDMTMQGFDLTDSQWQAIEPLLPQKSPRGGRPWKDHRTMINGMLWIEKSGGRWRDLPEQYGPWQSVYDRYTNWRTIGLWDRILSALPELEEELVGKG
jgi:transposase